MFFPVPGLVLFFAASAYSVSKIFSKQKKGLGEAEALDR